MTNGGRLCLLLLHLLPLLLPSAVAYTSDLLYRRETVVSTEHGHISTVTVTGNGQERYHLRFFTLQPGSLLLPILLHSDMVFYIVSGSGRLSWAEQEKMTRIYLKEGDIYRLNAGSVFFLQSDSQLRFHAIFPNFNELSLGPYTMLADVVLGFDKKILQASFQVAEDVIEELVSGPKQAPIVQEAAWVDAMQKGEMGFLGRSLLGFEVEKNKKKRAQIYNILREKPDFENCNGWSSMVTEKKSNVLKGTGIGVFVVSLTRSSMLGPHWNSKAMEIATVIESKGMVRVVCASVGDDYGCENKRFIVEEDDVFLVPRYRPVAQMSFNNGSLVVMGFTTVSKDNHPLFLSGKNSVLQMLDRNVVALSFNVSSWVIDRVVEAEDDSTIFECISCAEEEKLREEEEDQKKQEEEDRRRQEEEEDRKRREEEEGEEAERRKKECEEEKEHKGEGEERKGGEEEEWNSEGCYKEKI